MTVQETIRETSKQSKTSRTIDKELPQHAHNTCDNIQKCHSESHDKDWTKTVEHRTFPRAKRQSECNEAENIETRRSNNNTVADECRMYRRHNNSQQTMLYTTGFAFYAYASGYSHTGE